MNPGCVDNHNPIEAIFSIRSSLVAEACSIRSPTICDLEKANKAKKKKKKIYLNKKN